MNLQQSGLLVLAIALALFAIGGAIWWSSMKKSRAQREAGERAVPMTTNARAQLIVLIVLIWAAFTGLIYTRF